MTSIQDTFSANEELWKTHESVTAIFTGATHGIGLGTLKAFLRHIPKPKAIIIGRNKDKFAPELDALHQINVAAEMSFIEADLRLINEIDRACSLIKQEISPQSIDLLCMSQGYAPIGPRRFTKETLDEAMTLAVYGRVRIAQTLTTQNILSPTARIVSVLGGGKERHLFLEDLELNRNYSILNLRGHFTTIMTLAFDYLAERNPEMGFVHYFPGTVGTGTRTRIPEGSWVLRGSMWLLNLGIWMVGMTPQESGERVLGICCFGEGFARGSWSIGVDGRVSESVELKGYRESEAVKGRVWRHLEELFARAQTSISETG